jgi:TolA-binding protein
MEPPIQTTPGADIALVPEQPPAVEAPAATPPPPPAAATAPAKPAPPPGSKPPADPAAAKKAADQKTAPAQPETINVKEASPIVTPGPSPTKVAEDAAQVTFQAASSKIEAKLYDQGIADLRALISQNANSPIALQSYFLIARAYELQNRYDDAMAAYVEVRSRFPTHTRAPEALLKQASLMLISKQRDKEREARRLFGEVASNYPESSQAEQALVAKARLEERERMKEPDVALKAEVPSALITYRMLAERYPSSSEGALWKLGEMYDDLRRYDLAAQALTDLTSRFPNTKLDAWFRLAELYERRLRDREKARDAYSKVPSTSPQYKRAQNKVEDLSRQ